MKAETPAAAAEGPTMNAPSRFAVWRWAALLLVAGCASNRVAPPVVPAALRPPPGQSAFLEALATGAQIHECAAKPDAPDAFAWTFRAPEAALTDRAGRLIGKHYAGPTRDRRREHRGGRSRGARSQPGRVHHPLAAPDGQSDLGRGRLRRNEEHSADRYKGRRRAVHALFCGQRQAGRAGVAHGHLPPLSRELLADPRAERFGAHSDALRIQRR